MKGIVLRFLKALLILVLFGTVYEINAQNADGAQPVQYPIQVKDTETGIAIKGAVVRWQKVENEPPDHFDSTGFTGPDGRIVLSLPPGRYAVETTANGYKATCCRLVLQITEGMFVPKVIENLTPLKLPEEVVDLKSQLSDNLAIIGGYVVDVSTSRPIADAQIKFEKTGATAQSDSRGFFSAQIPASPPDDSPSATAEDLDLDTVRVVAKGYKTYRLKDVELSAGDVSIMVVPLEPGSGITDVDNVLPTAVTGDTPEHHLDFVPAKPLPKALEDWMHMVHTPQSMTSIPTLANPESPSSLAATMPPAGASPAVPMPGTVIVGSGSTSLLSH